jgi:outer membrane protein assembly factor BamD
MKRNVRFVLALALVAGIVVSAGCRRRKYENPITKDTQQPDKVLFDKAINDIERSRYEIARLTLQTLINTYDASEYLAKAKLAIADSWYREGGSHGLAQAEAEYKDFILFYPTMEEAAEAQEKVCDIHYKQMEKPDRDTVHALRAEEECRQLLVQFPNSKFAPEVQQKLRNIQEVLAEHEYRAGFFYHTKGSFPAAANRLQGLVDHYPLYSEADTALWNLGDAYGRMGDRFEDRSATAFTRIVRDYPLSEHADAAKERLKAMNRPVPDADPVAFARMKFELENRENPGMMHNFWGVFRKSPDTTFAAKSGSPTMTALQPTVPVSVPPAALLQGGGAPPGASAEVSAETVQDSTALDQGQDARQRPPSPQGQAPTEGQSAAPTGPAPDAAPAAPPAGQGATRPAAPPKVELAPQPQLPSNHQPAPSKDNKKKNDGKNQKQNTAK